MKSNYNTSNDPQGLESPIRGKDAYGTEEEIDLAAILRDYLRFWPIYVIVVALCLGAAWLYITVQKPKYPVKASVLFLDEKDNKSPQVQGIDFSELGMGVSNVNVDNELEILRSREIVKKALEESSEYVEVTSKKGLRTIVWYDNLPFVISMDPVGLSKVRGSIDFEIRPKADGGYKVIQEGVDDITIDSLPATFTLGEGIISMTKRTPKNVDVELPSSFDVKLSSPLRQAIHYSEKGGLTAERANKQSSVAVLRIESVNREKGEAFLAKLIEVYNRERAIDKDAAAQKTYNFINERINLIGDELSATESKLESVKKSQGITSYQDLGVVVSSSATMDIQKAEAETQLKLVSFLVKDLEKKKGKYEIIPGSLGFTDGTLKTAVELYNQMVFERNDLMESANAEHPRLITLSNNLDVARTNILEAANVAKQGLEIQLNGLKGLEKRYSSKIAEAPTFERISTDIERQRSIRSNLYLMLLTRREETSIQLAASLESARVIDTPLAANVPSSPKKPIILLAGLLLGVILPTGGIYVWKLTRNKVVIEDDVRALTTLPVVGSVPRSVEEAPDPKRPELVVKVEGNSQMTEVFRVIRTNLSFLTQNKRPLVVMATSTVSGEGKTFVVSNLAISLSALEQKVLLIGLDIRNPQLKRTFGIENSTVVGMSDLLNDSSLNPMDYLQFADGYPNLSIINAGTIPPSPPELLARPRLDELFEIFRQHFDYIIVDTAPVGPVVDSLVLNRVVDHTIYVTRSGRTYKKDFEYINYLNDHKKLKNISIVLNDVYIKDSLLVKSYGYGYGGYGYGYGYGRDHDTKKNK